MGTCMLLFCAVMFCYQDLTSILSNHAMGQALLGCTRLDSSKRKLLVDVLVNDMIVKYGR